MTTDSAEKKLRKTSVCGRPLPELRPPDSVMGLGRMGASFPHRLSFMRVFIRKLAAEKATMSIPYSSLDKDGFGHVVITLPLGGRDYSLIAYSQPLDATERTDRVIATKWDASFCLFDGVPKQADIDALKDQVTKQEAGRYHDKILTLSRANKSMRLFQHVVERLAAGQQPDLDKITSIGYLMRTTAVYGNGKFGIADYGCIAMRSGFKAPFQAEMLTVFLIREYTSLLADYCAQQKGGEDAVRLALPIRRYLGIGNSTGLGMAPFLVNHPVLLHSWVMAREIILAQARGMQIRGAQIRGAKAGTKQLERFDSLLDRAIRHCHEWVVDDEIQMAQIITLRRELAKLQGDIAKTPLSDSYPFDDAYRRSMAFSAETQELIGSVIIELVPDDIDALVDCMANPNEPLLFPAMSVGELKAMIAEHYAWVDDIKPDCPKADAQFWYTSEEKLEPRLGNRYEEPGAELEMPFNIPRYVKCLSVDLDKSEDAQTLAHFLMRHPEHRHMARRVQTTARYPYAEIRDNLVADGCRPIDLLRCKLSFFGASKFDPKSDRWLRIALYQGAPTAEDLQNDEAENLDDWIFALSPTKQDLQAVKSDAARF